MILRYMITTGMILGTFAIVGTGLVAVTNSGTQERIAEAKRQALAETLHALIPPERHDNDLATDIIDITAPEFLGSKKPVKVYRARKTGLPVAALFTTIAPDGYSGVIKLLVAVNADGSIAGVRVLAHRETPGLGDFIEESKSDWIMGFNGKSLFNPVEKNWKVRKDGGAFDHTTGATITPRAIVKAVYNTLSYYRQHQAEIFNAPAATTPEGTPHG